MGRDDTPIALREVAGAIAAALGLFLGFGVAFGAPFAVARECGEGWGVATGIAIGAAWMRWMPTTCRNGGFIWSVLGLWQVLLLCVWVVRAVVLLTALFAS